MTSDRNILMLGLSGAGKSTYLAALWGSIKGMSTACRLELESLGRDREYLETLWRKWSRGETLDKTAAGRVNPIVLNLSDTRRTPPERAVVQIPDMSGETFREQFESRQWTLEFQKRLADSSGIMLFVHAENMEAGVTLAEAQQVRSGLQDTEQSASPRTPPTDAQGSREQPDTPEPWAIRRCRTQVQLVDLLQCVARYVPLGRPRRLALVISAWDLIDVPLVTTPRSWVERRMGLLGQYLGTSVSSYTTELFGVSAQGFPYVKGEDPSPRLAEYPNESDRVRVRRGASEDERHDITEPLQWLLDG